MPLQIKKKNQGQNYGSLDLLLEDNKNSLLTNNTLPRPYSSFLTMNKAQRVSESTCDQTISFISAEAAKEKCYSGFSRSDNQRTSLAFPQYLLMNGDCKKKGKHDSHFRNSKTSFCRYCFSLFCSYLDTRDIWCFW